MLLGAGLWIRDLAAAKAAPVPGEASPTASPTAALAGPAEAPPPSSEGVNAPLPFRLGAGFMGGFLVAWTMRRFIRATLLIGGTIVAGIVLLKWTGIVDLDWGGLEQTVKDGVAQAQQHATTAKDYAMHHLPSGGASVAGMFIGARRG
jgi:uncharacterized membrane protein (Fun14 family)